VKNLTPSVGRASYILVQMSQQDLRYIDSCLWLRKRALWVRVDKFSPVMNMAKDEAWLGSRTMGVKGKLVISIFVRQ
jgi:hypothetical protein